MKALSIRQPWAWAILHAGKRIENRVWNTNYRGPILLHAAKGCTRREYDEAVEWMIAAGVVRNWWNVPPLDRLERGGIVARARIVDVFGRLLPGGIDPDDTMCSSFAKAYGIDIRWRMPEQYGFVLADVEMELFVPCAGALGLFEMDDPFGVVQA